MQIDIDVPSNARVAAALKGGPEHEFFTAMDGVTVKEDRNKYPNSVFLFKGDRLVMGVEELKNIWCSYELLWSKIEPHFNHSYDDTQHFIKRMVEKHFKLKDVTPELDYYSADDGVEEHFKLKDVTLVQAKNHHSPSVEEHFKLRDVAPFTDFRHPSPVVERHFKPKD